MARRRRNPLLAALRTAVAYPLARLRSSAVTLEQIYHQQRYPGSGAYPSTDPRRKVNDGWYPRPTTAQQLTWDLSRLTAQGRHLDRATPVFRGMVEGRKAELVGTGIAIEPDTGDTKLNQRIKAVLSRTLQKIGANEESIWTLQRMASGEIDCTGTFLWRLIAIEDRADQGLIPFCVLPLEIEWLSELPVQDIPQGHTFVRGVLLDRYGRAVAVDLVNPESVAGSPGERVPIDQVILGFERRRARQALGEPRLVTLIERTLQDDQLVIGEVKTAATSTGVGVVISSDELLPEDTDENGDAATRNSPPVTDIPMGGVAYVPSNAGVEVISNPRPNLNVVGFRETIRGDMAAGGQVSRVWTDRDGSKYNFANSKFDQIRTQQMVKPAHDWFGTLVASKVYEPLLPWIFLELGEEWPRDPAQQQRLRQHRLIPDVPPELDEAAAVKGFEAGFRNRVTSREDFIGSRGKDHAEVQKQIDAELLAEGQSAIARAVALQQACDQANQANPDLKLHWTQVVPTVANSDPLPVAAPTEGRPDA